MFAFQSQHTFDLDERNKRLISFTLCKVTFQAVMHRVKHLFSDLYNI